MSLNISYSGLPRELKYCRMLAQMTPIITVAESIIFGLWIIGGMMIFPYLGAWRIRRSKLHHRGEHIRNLQHYANDPMDSSPYWAKVSGWISKPVDRRDGAFVVMALGLYWVALPVSLFLVLTPDSIANITFGIAGIAISVAPLIWIAFDISH